MRRWSSSPAGGWVSAKCVRCVLASPMPCGRRSGSPEVSIQAGAAGELRPALGLLAPTGERSADGSSPWAGPWSRPRTVRSGGSCRRDRSRRLEFFARPRKASVLRLAGVAVGSAGGRGPFFAMAPGDVAHAGHRPARRHEVTKSFVPARRSRGSTCPTTTSVQHLALAALADRAVAHRCRVRGGPRLVSRSCWASCTGRARDVAVLRVYYSDFWSLALSSWARRRGTVRESGWRAGAATAAVVSALVDGPYFTSRAALSRCRSRGGRWRAGQDVRCLMADSPRALIELDAL